MIDLFLFDLVNIGYFLMLQCSSRCLKGFYDDYLYSVFPLLSPRVNDLL